MPTPLIDVWNVETFDDELRAALAAETPLLRSYFETERQQYLERQASDHTGAPPSNSFAKAFYTFSDSLIPLISRRTIRAWHYTRLTDTEVAAIRANGLYPGTLESTRRRQQACVAEGLLSPEDAAILFAESPFHSDQSQARAGKFWMTATPIPVQDGGVELLLRHWGGEATYFWQKRPTLVERLRAIGTPTVLEIAVPVQITNQAASAATDVVRAYARSIGCATDRCGFDLYATEALPASALLAIHQPGAAPFRDLGRGYPPGFRDTAEEDWARLRADARALGVSIPYLESD